VKTRKGALIGVVLVFLGAAALAQNQLTGLVQSGEYRPAPEGGLRQPAAVPPAGEDVYAVGPYLSNPPELAAGEGVDSVHVYCQLCHSNTYITMQPPLPAETWEAEVKKMMETHGAAMPEEAVPEIIAYLKAHYTPETRKK
jgi:hypothetical protein